MQLQAFSATVVSRMIHHREVSSLELTELLLARIANLNPRLNAFTFVDAEGARSAARRADQELARGTDRGALHGIPLALKDLFDTKGWRTTAGSKILRERIPTEDAAVTERLKNAGAVLLGILNMDEFALGTTNDNPHYGRCRNPWNLERAPGGSSGGAGAAVAARLCLGSIGTDTGGSIRIPASLCGVTGLKPTFGRVSLRGAIPLSWSMDHAGPIAASAEDAFMLLQAIAGYDPQDPVSIDVPVPNYGQWLDRSIDGVRIAVAPGYFDSQVDAQVAQSIEQALCILASCGAISIRKDMPFADELYQMNRVIVPAEGATYHAHHLETRVEEYGNAARTRLTAGLATPLTDYVRARRRQMELTRMLGQYLTDVDLLVTPTTRVAAPVFGDSVRAAQTLTALTAPFNLTGFPAISIPCGFTADGLPIGLQMVARPWEESLLLQVAHRYQSVTDWHTRLPGGIG